MNRRAAGLLARTGVPLGFLASALLVWHTSNAAFSATTSNPGNNWATGTVTISDDDGGSTAMFSATGLKPGSTGTKCIAVTYGGSLAAAVKLYVSSTTPGTPDLSPYLQLTIEEGSGATFAGGCGSFVSSATLTTATTLTALAAARTNYGNGLGTWAPSGSATKSYRFTYTVDSAAPNGAQAAGTQASFTWEAQNT